jgi:uncharacterized cupin superfamily protein
MLDNIPVPEASLAPSPDGFTPEGEGWFIVNIAEARGMRSERFGAGCRFEGEQRFLELGINVRVLEPGQPNALYHRESPQEDFLVLSGECIAIVEEQERPMRKGDFLHAPPGTAHVFVGAGDGPCVILMVGTRDPDEDLLYPVSETAARHGASAEHATDDPAIAYAGTPPPRPAMIGLPW